MSKHKVEIFLKGEFTTVDVFLEGDEIPLREIDNNEYYKKFEQFEISGPLNINVRLKGFFTMDWEFNIDVDGQSVFSNPPVSGTFDEKGFVSFAREVEITTLPLNA